MADVLKEVLDALRQGAVLGREGLVPAAVVREAGELQTVSALVRQAQTARLATEAASLARETQDTATALERYDAVMRRLERALDQTRIRQALRQGLTVSDAVRRLGPRGAVEVAELFDEVSMANRVQLATCAARLMQDRAAVSTGVLNNMAGQVREVLVKQLPEVRALVAEETATLRRSVSARGDLQLIDTGYHGDVELPTKLKGQDRFIRLGTDRIVGVARFDASLRTEADFFVSGALDVKVAIEVKGATNVVGGVEQLRNLQARTTPGYAIIDGEFWLLRYEPAKVSHVVIAPEGKAMATARRTADQLTKTGAATQVITISAELDADMRALARAYLEAAAGL